MAEEDAITRDVRAALPVPPPPAPLAREAAIDAALRRFDGAEVVPKSPPPRFALRHRPQLAGLVAVSLVAVIGLPAAWLALDRGSPAVEAAREGATADLAQPPPSVAAPEPAASPAAVASVAAPPEEDAPPPAPVPALSPPPPPVMAVAPTVSAPAPAPPAPDAPPEVADKASDNDYRPESRGFSLRMAGAPVVAAPPPPPPAVASRPRALAGAVRAESAAKAVGRAEAIEQDDDSANVIVTAQRRRRSGPDYANTRGPWNACTIDDPRRNLSACRAEVKPGVAGARGQADAFLAEGLAQAWQGNAGGAVTAFDRSLAVAPRSALALLNRGLARAQAGDSAGALADLDQAVRLAPGSARARYARSRVLRERGETRRADAEQNRAVELDPAFGELTD